MCGDREGCGGKGREVKASERLSEGAVVEKTNACGFVRKKVTLMLVQLLDPIS